VPFEKVSLSLEGDVVAEARAESGGNLSAYVNEAVEAKLRNARLRQLVDDFRDEFRPSSTEDDEAFRREVRDAFAATDAAAAAVEPAILAVQELLNSRESVAEAVVVVGALGLPVAYVVPADEEDSISAFADDLYREMALRAAQAYVPSLVIVPGRPKELRSRSGRVLPEVLPR
jgi:hypothetical protein